jgi:flagellar assembly protein FliH
MTSSKPIEPRQVPPPEGSAERSTNAYARFIPREELGGFESWTPDAFAAPLRADKRAAQSAAPAAAPEPAPPPPPPPPTEAQWQARLNEARQQGWQDGHRDGLEALDAAKRQFAQQTTAQMTALLDSVQAQFDALEGQLAEAVIKTAVLLARQVVRSELTHRPELVVPVAQQAVEAMMVAARQLRLRLHPQDLGLVEEAIGEELKARQVTLQADESLAQGGCLLESDLGKVDARIDKRWLQAAAVFGAPVAWHDAAPADLPTDAAEPATKPAEPVEAAAP